MCQRSKHYEIVQNACWIRVLMIGLHAIKVYYVKALFILLLLYDINKRQDLVGFLQGLVQVGS